MSSKRSTRKRKLPTEPLRLEGEPGTPFDPADLSEHRHPQHERKSAQLCEQVAEALSWVAHTRIETETDTCTIRLRSDRLDSLVMAVVRLALRASVDVLEPRAVADEVAALGSRLNRP